MSVSVSMYVCVCVCACVCVMSVPVSVSMSVPAPGSLPLPLSPCVVTHSWASAHKPDSIPTTQPSKRRFNTQHHDAHSPKHTNSTNADTIFPPPPTSVSSAELQTVARMAGHISAVLHTEMHIASASSGYTADATHHIRPKMSEERHQSTSARDQLLASSGVDLAIHLTKC